MRISDNSEYKFVENPILPERFLAKIRLTWSVFATIFVKLLIFVRKENFSWSSI